MKRMLAYWRVVPIVAGLAAGAALAVAGLGGCAAPAAPAAPPREACSAASPCSHDDTRNIDWGWTEQHVKLRDGRTITCIAFSNSSGSQSGLSCDWGPR